MSNERIVADSSQRVQPIVRMSLRDVLVTLAVGLGVGLLVGVLAYLLANFVFNPILCTDAENSKCGSVTGYATTAAMIIGGIVGLIGLVQARIYRPLLVVLAATVALWGITGVLLPMHWFMSLVMGMLLFAVSYLLFAWLARIRSFLMAMVVTVVAVVIIRLILVL